MGIRYTMYRIGVHQWKEKAMFKIAWWIPARLVYFCTIRLLTYASTTDEYAKTHPCDIKGMDAVKKFSDDFNLYGKKS